MIFFPEVKPPVAILTSWKWEQAEANIFPKRSYIKCFELSELLTLWNAFGTHTFDLSFVVMEFLAWSMKSVMLCYVIVVLHRPIWKFMVYRTLNRTVKKIWGDWGSHGPRRIGSDGYLSHKSEKIRTWNARAMQKKHQRSCCISRPTSDYVYIVLFWLACFVDFVPPHKRPLKGVKKSGGCRGEVAVRRWSRYGDYAPFL